MQIFRKLTIYWLISMCFGLLGTSLALAQNELTIPEVSKEDRICFALYTVQNNILKLTAQLYPMGNVDSRTVHLQIEEGDGWKNITSTDIIYPGFTAPFRVENWDSSQDIRYRVVHQNTSS